LLLLTVPDIPARADTSWCLKTKRRRDNCGIKRRLSIAIIGPRDAADIPAAISECISIAVGAMLFFSMNENVARAGETIG
jgi:hypothetical protein